MAVVIVGCFVVGVEFAGSIVLLYVLHDLAFSVFRSCDVKLYVEAVLRVEPFSESLGIVIGAVVYYRSALSFCVGCGRAVLRRRRIVRSSLHRIDFDAVGRERDGGVVDILQEDVGCVGERVALLCLGVDDGESERDGAGG